MQPLANSTEDLTLVSESLPNSEQNGQAQGSEQVSQPEKKTRKPRQKKNIETLPQTAPIGISESSARGNRRRDKFDKLEDMLTEQLSGIVGLPALIGQLMQNEKLVADANIVGSRVGSLSHHTIQLARQNEHIEKFLSQVVTDSAVFGLVIDGVMIGAGIYFNHTDRLPPAVLAGIFADMEAGATPNGGRTNG